MRRNKKGVETQLLFWILVPILCAMVIFAAIKGFASQAEGPVAEALCRASIALREKHTANLPAGVTLKLGPILCQTQHKELPEANVNTAEAIQREMANLVARCWWMFGEGLIENNVLDRTTIGADRCFVCYTFEIREIKDKQKIDAGEFIKFLTKNKYEKRFQLVEVCGNGEDDDGDRAIDEEDCMDEEELEEPTYMAYVQDHAGPGTGAILFRPVQMSSFKKREEIYAITFIARTTERAWLEDDNINRILVSPLTQVEEECQQVLVATD